MHALARVDAAIALFYEGAYRASETAFRNLTRTPGPLPGVDRRQVARWLNHARACAGYHALHEKAGIREPARLDPLCGAELIAVALRSLKRPFDRKTVLAKVRVTGMGSTMNDLLDAGKKLGLAPHVVATGDAGLKLLPVPLVASVEHDHFVAVYRADKSGVTYLCSDCGAWPGGERTVTWKQWKLMEAGPFMTLSVPGSVEDRALSQLAGSGKAIAAGGHGISTAHATLAAYEGGSDIAQVARLAELLKAAAVRDYRTETPASCGDRPGSQACCPENCPTDGGNTRGGNGSDGGLGGRSNPASRLASDFGPSYGDPVNLATGEEEYHPAADMTVYNPIGPSVSMSRLYNSLRPNDPTYENDDFGSGWSHPYNITVYDPTVNVNIPIRQGSTAQCAVTGSDAPGSGLTWDIMLAGSTVATSSSSGGWSVSSFSSSIISVSPPSGATVATNYKVRYMAFGGARSSGFDVISSSSPSQVPQGGTANMTTTTGSDAPGTGLTWDIVQSGTTVASSSSPNGWSAVSATPITVGAPPLASPGSYEVRTHFSGHGILSCVFAVYAVDYMPKTGTRYLIEPNGARMAITASSVPTSGSPTVVCSVPAGYAYYVEWKYASGYPSGYYVITGPDRSQMITTTAAKAVGVTISMGASSYASVSAILCVLGQIVDNNGNAINFWYGAAGPSGFPLLSSITDSGGSALVSFTHDATSGGITAMSDRYNRSVYYSISSYLTVNVPGGWPQYLYEVDHVSQIVLTGTASPPDRYAYGYQAVANGESTEEIRLCTRSPFPRQQEAARQRRRSTTRPMAPAW